LRLLFKAGAHRVMCKHVQLKGNVYYYSLLVTSLKAWVGIKEAGAHSSDSARRQDRRQPQGPRTVLNASSASSDHPDWAMDGRLSGPCASHVSRKAARK
jgi:hypothetical protein